MSGPPDWLAGEVTAVALCWRLTRADGLLLGFTSHDRDIWVDGVLFRAGPGMTPSAVSQGDALKVDSMEIEGALQAGSLSAFDLECGRWAGARVELFACGWGGDAGAPRLTLMRGSIGDVSRPFQTGRGDFRAELLSEAHRLELVTPLRVSPTCRAELGDGRCGVDMEPRRFEARLASGGGDRLLLPDGPATARDWQGGRVRFLDGLLAGVDRRIAEVVGVEILLEEPVPDVDLSGMRVSVWQGCDKRFETCRSRFANAAAFDGEPHVPGTDALVRYSDG